jgi:hypothetical protein
MLTLILTAVALVILAGAMDWSANSTRMTYRYDQYGRAVVAAEGDTEKVIAQIQNDFVNGGLAAVNANLSGYSQLTPTAADSAYWSDWTFNDASGHAGQTFVQYQNATNYEVLDSTYAGLKGFVTTMTVVSDARQMDDSQNVVGAVYRQIKLAQIPIFQFLMYTTGDMEISCGEPFTITGRVHSNAELYIEPDNLLTFQSSVDAVGDILFERDPLDTRAAPAGSVVYQIQPQAHSDALNLPIGTNNTPTAVREIIEPPPAGESPASPMGQLRYYNQADMVLIVSNSSVTAESGSFNDFATAVPAGQVALFVSTNASFTDDRESKTVQPVDINIGALTAWSATNTTMRAALGGRDVSSIYVLDRRNLGAGQLGAVRVENGLQLPSRGLTVATGDPLYVWGNYNQTNAAFLGINDTSTTLPASLIGDALTVLSVNWTDANSANAVAARVAGPTTVNAAILAGDVPTVAGQYSGGMENFPRFLETWGAANPFTYNGAMIKMFPSLYATNYWGKNNVYVPPARNWAYDINFENPTKLPPLTPSLLRVIRGQWATIAPNQTSAP